ncbi:uncharacterized protein LOC112507505 [Cynara cardunculus var. scolymus]|uniref:Uncharacterized protein n=1 Tax=Cynara cardunculus var. scolymus TaxID=59895 RepID=A0A103YLJ1_CYNCS|nr:uncharacterized protein LOC112507505 [Cynara cardunculus var. scolymus]KVI11304.1 hypothetical protein Ccrd_010287 [Cynara cardunculus var. scolymus]
MNAVSNSQINFTEETAGGSDTDTISDDSPEYYEPISSGAIDDEDSSDQNSDNDLEPNFHCLQNGDARCVQNGMDSLDLSDEDDEEEEEDDRMRQAMQRAFREDESRRRAPLTPENTTRVMEAMRGISFRGLAPDWAGQVPEDRWINQLASIRQPPSSTAS